MTALSLALSLSLSLSVCVCVCVCVCVSLPRALAFVARSTCHWLAVQPANCNPTAPKLQRVFSILPRVHVDTLKLERLNVEEYLY